MIANDRFNVREAGSLTVDATVSRRNLPSERHPVLIRLRSTINNRHLQVECTDREALNIAYQIVALCDGQHEYVGELISRTRRAVRIVEALREIGATREQAETLDEKGWELASKRAFGPNEKYVPGDKTRAMVLEML